MPSPWSIGEDDTMAQTKISPQAIDLEFARTIDRTLVHRESLAEVFLTDSRQVDEDTYAVAAFLPRSHAYYGDHLLTPAAYDPMLLLEACRQGAILGAHRHYDVPLDHKFILTHMRIRIERPELLTVGAKPRRVTMTVTTSRRIRDDRITGIDYAMRLEIAGFEFGSAAIGMRFKSPEGYMALRLRNRDGALLRSTSVPPEQSPGAPVAPHLVGRMLPDNVVLCDAKAERSGASAVLRLAANHPSLFDHPQDHIPGMVLAEAARQVVHYGALEVRGVSAVKSYLTELSATFSAFGELERDITLHASIGAPEPASGPGSPLAEDGITYTAAGPGEIEGLPGDPAAAPLTVVADVDVRQNDRSICAVGCVLTGVHGR
ncbi:ScbA/BarX family gamma-butyrolactone biosynthesis protein [Actinomadura litoris]|uniref:ScbA/BarX family gamma-butyrolactone biosynthesis protein n=1 Tax=Actinomadura litoris TaxID=2678616 RepID=UPI0027B97B50|nr:ScbA/BarX family gamma-butyrolactone biosynthesis protein [Actinomadura litoris]